MKKTTPSLLTLHIGKTWGHVLFCAGIITVSIAFSYAGRSNRLLVHRQTVFFALVLSLFFLGCAYTGRWLYANWLLKKRFWNFFVYCIEYMITWTTLGGFFVLYFFHPINKSIFSILVIFFPFVLFGLGAGIATKMIGPVCDDQKE